MIYVKKILSYNENPKIFEAAISVNGGDINPDEPPTCTDYIMHYVTLPFKLVFATVPPSEYYGGWACFWTALFFIAVVTVVTIFTVCSICCFSILYIRRRVFGVELGGPKSSANITAFTFCGMWLFYVIMSSLKAYGHLG